MAGFAVQRKGVFGNVCLMAVFRFIFDKFGNKFVGWGQGLKNYFPA